MQPFKLFSAASTISDMAPAALLPLDGARGLAGDVIDDAVDGAHAVADAAGHRLQELGLKGVPVGRHAVPAGHCAQRNHAAVRPLVPLYPHRPAPNHNCFNAGGDDEHGRGSDLLSMYGTGNYRPRPSRT